MRKIILLAILLLIPGFLFAREEKAQEKSNTKKSVFQYNNKSDYYYCLPRNYNKNENISSKYPLVIYLHGGGGAGKINTLDFLGYSENNSPDNQKAENFQVNYPSIILVPQSPAGGWDPEKIIPLVEEFKSKYRIDNKRIYLIGYSMGGSGSYIFANGYYDYNQTLFAAIIRLAGQSQTTLREAISVNTSVWLHIGLNDVPKRIDVTREAYDFLKLKCIDSSESIENVNINGITGKTITLHSSNETEIKKTEYNDTGHGISRFPFDDNRLIKWMFGQRLK
jgi:predicted peptidase